MSIARLIGDPQTCLPIANASVQASYPDIYNAVPIGLGVIDGAFRLVTVNRRFAEMVGLRAASCVGHPLSEVAPALAARLTPALHHALAGRTAPQVEIEIGVGEKRAIQFTLEPLRPAAGDITAVLCSAVDVTERRQVEETLRDHRERLSTLIEQAAVGISQSDLQGRILLVNDRLCEITGHPREALLGHYMQEITHPDDLVANLPLLRRLAETGEPFSIEKRYIKPDGSVVWANTHVSATFDAAGRPQFVVALVQDIGERLRAEEARRASEEFSRSVLESSLDCIEVLDLDGRLLFMNDAGQQLMEIADITQFLGRIWSSLLPPEAWSEAQRAIDCAKAGQATKITMFCPTALGTDKWWEVVLSPIQGPHGDVVRVLSISRDITERHLAEQQIKHLAFHDSLTGLANRILFSKELEQALGEADASPLAVLYLDLDQFKGVNDTLGHSVGDALLIQVADRLILNLDPGDMVARLGGDEFAIIRRNKDGLDDARLLARRIIDSLNEPFEVAENQLVIGASIGIGLAPRHGSTPQDLTRNADIALYRAKADGRGVYRVFEPAMDEAIQREQELKAGLRGAVERGEMEVHFQPLVNLENGGIACCEALLRWFSPTQGPISPAEFIPIAEESGMIIALGEWVLRQACREATSWPEDVRLAVNLSPTQFRGPGLLSVVTEALAATGLAPDRLELEITESVLLQENEANLATLHALRRLGIRIVLDDFGTGFSSLAYLLRFPFDKIKIDRSFIEGLPEREASVAIVCAVMGIGKSLGIGVTAEGVETAEQLAQLRDRGCNEAQGHFLGRPVPGRDIRNILPPSRQ